MRFVLFVLLLVPSLLNATVFYGITNTRQFGTLDTSTGIFSAVGSPLVAVNPPGGLALVSNVLYTAPTSNNAPLYSIDPVAGTFNSVATLSERPVLLGSTDTAIWMRSISSSTTGTVDPVTGVFTTVLGNLLNGSTLSVGGQELYSLTVSQLYRLDTTQSAWALVGNTGLGFTGWDSLAIANGIGYATTGASIYTINLSNGQATFLSGITGASRLYGLAPIITPEPSMMGLTFGGLLFLGWRTRRSR